MDTFSEPLTVSVTTGLPSPTPRDESSIGPRPGETGSARMSNKCTDLEPLEPGTARWDSLMEAVRARDAERAAEVRKLKDSAPWHGVPIERFTKGRWIRPSDLDAPHKIEDSRSSYLRMEYYESIPPSLSEAQAAEVRRRLAIARERAAPAPREQIAAMILKLAAVVRIPEMAGIETMTEIMIEELSDVSPEVLEHTFRHWIRTAKFFPTIAELIEITEPQMATLRNERYKLERLASVAANPAPDLWVTGDWLDARNSDARAAAYPPAVRDKLNSRRLIERKEY